MRIGDIVTYKGWEYHRVARTKTCDGISGYCGYCGGMIGNHEYWVCECGEEDLGDHHIEVVEFVPDGELICGKPVGKKIGVGE